MSARQWWKITWRLIRVSRREQAKAATDMMLYGTGVVKIPHDGGDPCHIPIENVTFELAQKMLNQQDVPKDWPDTFES